MIYDIYIKTEYEPLIFKAGLAQDQLNGFINTLNEDEKKQIYILPRVKERKDD